MSDNQEQLEVFNIGQRLTATIQDVAFGGEGVARVNQFVIFVPFVIQGEEVEIELTEIKTNFARGRLLKVLKPSALRVKPECRYFGACGGCQYQHIEYSAQLEIKRKQVADLLERIGKFSQQVVAPAIPCPQPYGYRNRIMIRSQWNKFKQGLEIGFIRADSRLVEDIEECKIAEPAINQQITHVRANPPPKGGLKVVLRVAPEGWEVPRDSFFQNNFFLLPKLVEVVGERVKDMGSRFLIDAYCWVGFFGLELSSAVEQCVGIELDTQAVAAGRRNAMKQNRPNVQFMQGRTEDLLPEVLKRFSADSCTVLIDPPRVGCLRASLELLRQSGPAQIIYVSCHPATLARDLNVLCADGVFECKKIVPLDMFPQTQHLECVADLRRVGGRGV
jgi:tRNA/tmRNA/rRNA uracil-C5-methylase (TrmA/RlmC/RlmD family)